MTAASAIAKGPRSCTREEYDAIPAINWSTLKCMRQSPKHYRHRLANPLDDCASFILGRAGHTAVLEPDRFLIDYVLFKGKRRAGKEYEALLDAHPEETILKESEYELALAIRDAVREHAVAGPYFAKGRAEQCIVWTDPETGLLCKARLDWICDVAGLAALADLKSTSTIDATLFATTSARMGYPGQMAFYTRGLRALGLLMPAKIVAVEAKPPHDCGVFDVDADVLTFGDEEVGELLAKVKYCRETDRWPGRFPDREQVLTLPRWAFPAEDDFGGLTGLAQEA